MWTWIPAIGVLAFAGCSVAIPFKMAMTLARYVRNYSAPEALDDAPPVLVVLPVKGIEAELPDLESNLRAVLDQDYPSFHVVFAVGDENDLAVPVIRKLCDQYPGAQLVVAPHRDGQSQKISNQLRALEELKTDDAAIAFFDSDAQPGKDILTQLIAPLRDPGVGATTGFRWYTPVRGNFASWLRASWNASGMPILIDPKLNYAWGGAMAIRKDVFESCGVAEYWSKALSDDLGLSLLVKQNGYGITLVPPCLVRSPEDLDLGPMFEWTSRQTVICRVYNPAMWRQVFVGEALTAVTLIAGGAVAVFGWCTDQWVATATGALAVLAVVVGRMIYQASIVAIARGLAKGLVPTGSNWKIVAVAPLVIPVILINSVRSWMSRRITWRGIKYDLRGPLDIAVVDRD